MNMCILCSTSKKFICTTRPIYWLIVAFFIQLHLSIHNALYVFTCLWAYEVLRAYDLTMVSTLKTNNNTMPSLYLLLVYLFIYSFISCHLLLYLIFVEMILFVGKTFVELYELYTRNDARKQCFVFYVTKVKSNKMTKLL